MDTGLLVPVIVLAVLLLVAPAGAALREATYRGTVTAVDPSNQTITITADAEYRCGARDGNPACAWTPIEPIPVTGRVPDPLALVTVSPGSAVAATITGGPGGAWIGIGRVHSAGETFYADLVIGEPSSVPVPLAGGYRVSATTEPDCSACSGTVCAARSARVALAKNEVVVAEWVLAPREEMRYGHGAGADEVTVAFLSGQASSTTCSPDRPIVGPRPVSVYVIRAAGASPDVSGTTTPAPTPPTTPAVPGAEAFVAVAALVLVGLLASRARP